MKQNRKQIILLLFSISIMLSHTAWCDDDDVKIRVRELEKVKAQIEAMDQSIDQNKNLQNQASNRISETNAKIKTIEKELAQLEGLIGACEREIESKGQELLQIKAEIEYKNETLNSRLRAMYKTDVIGYIDVLLGAEDFVDFLTRIDMIQKILQYDQELIQFMEESRALINSKCLELETQREVYKKLSSNKVEKQADLEVELEAMKQYKAHLENDEKALMRLESEFLNEANQLTQVIKNMDTSEAYIGGEMTWPIPNHHTIFSQFGKQLHPISKEEVMHTGIDILCERNSNVVAAQSGTVIYANWYGGYGKVVIIDHGGGYTTLYGYNDKLNIQVGDVVKKGDMISKSGASGSTIKPCLHFEIRINGEYCDPLTYVKME
ncbi:murein hydrolase activator EnvC family protein [Fusibacter ferrireducens]|uniref:Peptidoglycan DD-metalloendopeptidase family protein n=1 Tax=Fusibacter ferrireducens TaxID=2785058 RepID=A0ABR9ZZM6_9FIRM|nr:M23 family metallopeptidase [Fusibacter ferrireducens]MBF4695891.1 peptidoglycan DD-metalloendopeptidase family protein [Fusibacter ferrireducens]